uniref:Uncharacterized protein n=1 Tax=Siphoviridae sp. ctbQZ1 TaxID=2827581 RepID=A0A8S5LNE1_9CAUD|nr:MAG TPA: hypothetical protein [Siphoviridae sp. ctbQZ1]
MVLSVTSKFFVFITPFKLPFKKIYRTNIRM